MPRRSPTGSEQHDIGEEPVLIPVGTKDHVETVKAVAGECYPTAKRGVTDYGTGVFMASLIPGVLAWLMLGLAAILPWAHVPQPPGVSMVRGSVGLLFADNDLSTLLGAVPLGGHRILVAPIALLVISVAVILMPTRRLRGVALSVVALTAALVWFEMLHRAQDYVVLCRPIARLMQRPELRGFWIPPAATTGAGGWVMGGGIALLVIAGGLNVCRSPLALAAVVVSALLAGGTGLSYLNDWWQPYKPRVDVRVERMKATEMSAGLSGPSSEAIVELSVVNKSGRPMVLAPAFYSVPDRYAAALVESGEPVPDTVVSASVVYDPAMNQKRTLWQGAGSGHVREGTRTDAAVPGGWAFEWGKPDLVLCAAEKSGLGEETPPGQYPTVLCSFDGDKRAGMVLPRGGRGKIELTFRPAWQRGLVRWPTASGTWSVFLVDAKQVVRSSFDVEVPGVEHPHDRRVKELQDKTQNMWRGVTQAIADLTAWLGKSPTTDVALLGPQARQQATKLSQAARSLDACLSSVRDLQALASGRPRTEEKGSALPTESNLKQLSTAIQAIEEGMPIAAEQALTKLTAASDQAGVMAKLMLQSFQPLLLIHARDCNEQGNYQAAIRIMVEMDESYVRKSNLGSSAADILLGALEKCLARAGVSLIKPNGEMPLAGSKAASWISRGSAHERRPANEAQRLYETSKGDIADKSLGESLPQAIARLESWNPALKNTERLAYVSLLVTGASQGPGPDQVLQFVGRYPRSTRSPEAWCWLGMRALLSGERPRALEHLQQVPSSEQTAAAEFGALAQLGMAVAAFGMCEDDCVKRLCAASGVLKCSRERNDWSPEVSALVQSIVPRDLATASWVAKITIVDSPQGLESWLAGGPRTIGWLRLSREQVTDQMLKRVQQSVSGGAIIWVSSPLIREFGIPSQRPPAALLSGTADIVPAWQQLSGPTLRVSQVRYDAASYGVLIPDEAVGANRAVYAILAVTTPVQAGPGGRSVRLPRPVNPTPEIWLVCAAKAAGSGLVAFVPGRMPDTSENRRFLESLVVHRSP